MSARMGDAIGANVNRTGAHNCKASTTSAYKSGVSTGKGSIDFVTSNAPEPCVDYFDKAKAAVNDGRSRTKPR